MHFCILEKMNHTKNAVLHVFTALDKLHNKIDVELRETIASIRGNFELQNNVHSALGILTGLQSLQNHSALPNAQHVKNMVNAAISHIDELPNPPRDALSSVIMQASNIINHAVLEDKTDLIPQINFILWKLSNIPVVLNLGPNALYEALNGVLHTLRDVLCTLLDTAQALHEELQEPWVTIQSLIEKAQLVVDALPHKRYF